MFKILHIDHIGIGVNDLAAIKDVFGEKLGMFHQPEDEVVNIRVVTENQHIVLQTADGFFLRFPAAEVTEKKKGAIGVRGIRLKKDDALTNVYLFEEGTECKISYHEKEVTLNRLKLAKRDGTGTKYRG